MLSDVLKELRIQKKATQDDMAKLLNIKRQTYSAYERGISLPDAPSLISISKYFGVSVDYLLGNDTSEQALSPRLKAILQLAEQLSEEDADKLMDYGELLKKARTQ